MAREFFFNEIDDKLKLKVFNEVINMELEKNPNGTNGKLTLEEYLEKKPKIKNKLDEDEEIRYILYKKTIWEIKLIGGTIFSGFGVFFYLSHNCFEWKMILIFIILLFFSGRVLGETYITNKSIIFFEYRYFLFRFKITDLAKVTVDQRNHVVLYLKKKRKLLSNRYSVFFLEKYIENLEEIIEE